MRLMISIRIQYTNITNIVKLNGNTRLKNYKKYHWINFNVDGRLTIREMYTNRRNSILEMNCSRKDARQMWRRNALKITGSYSWGGGWVSYPPWIFFLWIHSQIDTNDLFFI